MLPSFSKTTQLDKKDYILAGLLSLGLILGLDALTNSMDTHKFAWDFRYYIALAQDGFNARPLVSPYVYRYATPLLVKALSMLGLSIEGGFRVLAYLGACLQLMGVFAFTGWFTHSRKASFLALLVTGLSLFNIKFLLFDVFRPDHFAYAFILLATYLAFQRKFVPLLIVTLVASQFREFTIIPLIAYLFSFARMESRASFRAQAGLSALVLFLALGLPRYLLPVTEDVQFVNLTIAGLLRGLWAPIIVTRDINFMYTVIAYFLPLFMVASPPQIKAAYNSLTDEVRRFLFVYTAMVLLFSFFGGTDFPRFATFLFIPQIILLGLLSDKVNNIVIILMLIAISIFNLVWLPIPLTSLGDYRDFYSGYQIQVTTTTIWRIVELTAFILLGWLAQSKFPSADN